MVPLAPQRSMVEITKKKKYWHPMGRYHQQENKDMQLGKSSFLGSLNERYFLSQRSILDSNG
jgi:hypothetical protein